MYMHSLLNDKWLLIFFRFYSTVNTFLEIESKSNDFVESLCTGLNSLMYASISENALKTFKRTTSRPSKFTCNRTL